MIHIVRKGIVYRNKKGNPITREQIKRLNGLIAKISFKIPELWEPSFLDTLPSSFSPAPEEISSKPTPEMNKLKEQHFRLTNLPSQERGLAFECFLNDLFATFNLGPRGSFRLRGEQIDGSFELDHKVYLLEAKWHDMQTGQAELLVFREKVEAKASWGRGLFISHSGFSDEGLEAYSRGRSTNLIGMSGQDLYFILEGKMTMPQALRLKVRLAAETGRFYVPVQEIYLRVNH